MVIFSKLVLIGFISGVLLAAIMKIIRKTTGNKADILLYNMDYIPVLKQWSDRSMTGILFHYATCISSAVVLYYILLPMSLELAVWPYAVVFTVGGGALYFLSALTETPPSKNDTAAWFYWTLGHALFGFAVGGLITIFI